MWNAFYLAAAEGFGVKYGWSIGKQSTGLFSLRRETRPFRATDSRSNYSNPCRLRKKTAVPNGTTVFLAAGEGFEPSQTESESGVLPLHKPAICLASKRISNYMQILEKVKQKIAFSEKFSILSAAKLRYLGKPPADFVIALRAVGKQAGGAVLDAAFRVGEAAAALFAQGVEGTVAEQAVEAVLLRRLVAGEIFTLAVLKETIAHSAAPIRSPRRTLVSMPCAL